MDAAFCNLGTAKSWGVVGALSGRLARRLQISRLVAAFLFRRRGRAYPRGVLADFE